MTIKVKVMGYAMLYVTLIMFVSTTHFDSIAMFTHFVYLLFQNLSWY